MRSRLAQPVLWIVLSCAALSPRLAGATWPPTGTPFCTASNDQFSPKICLDRSGGAIVTWMDSRSNPATFDIYAQRVSATGVPLWTSDGVPVCTASGDQNDPVIIPDGADGAIIAWVDFRNSAGDIYAQRLNASGVAQWTPNGVAVCDTIDSQFGARIVSDAAGGAIITWQDHRDTVSATANIFAQRLNAAGVRQWLKNGVGVCTAPEDQLAPEITSDGAGGAIVTWVDDRDLDSDIYAQRVNGAGVAQWTANGVKVCGASGFESEPVIAADGSGGAVVAWSDLRNGSPSFDIYAQRVDAGGSTKWQNDGQVLCGEESDQDVPVIASDGAGGAIVAWEDFRNGSSDIYIQRADAAGTPQWPTDGIALCSAIGTQNQPRIVPDCVGGAVVAWADYRGSVFNPDIYAQRVDTFGLALWTSDGVALCSAGSFQVSPDLVADGDCGAIVAWEDARSGTSGDIYGQRVNSSGVISPTLDAPTVPGASFQVLAPRPNPVRSGTAFAFVLPYPQSVTVELFDLRGRRVRALAERAWLGAGVQSLTWDVRDQAGAPVSAGLYLLRVSAPGGSGVRKVTVIP